MTIGDLTEVNFSATLAGQPIDVTLGFAQIGTTTGDQRAALNTAVVANLFTPLRNCSSSDLVYSQIGYKDVSPGTRAELVVNAGVSPGSRAAGAMPSQNCAVLTLRTPVAGRSYRGRVHIPGLLPTDVVNDLLQTTVVTLLNTLGTQIVNVFGATGTNPDFTCGVISRFHLGIKRPNPILTSYTGYTVQPDVRSLRRRQYGVRIHRRH